METLKSFDLLSLALRVFGVLLSIYFGLEARRQRIKNIKYDWQDIQLGARKLARKVFSNFSPDVIFSSSGPSALVANLMLTEMDTYIPVYIGFSQKIGKINFQPPVSHQIKIETTKWITFLPNEVLTLKNKRILVVEDCVITGDTLTELVKLFVSNGIDRNNILVASLIVTEFALSSGKGPDEYYFKVSDSGVFYTPWGKGVGRDY